MMLTSGFTHSLAIIIGIDAYGHGIPPLSTAVNDATRLAKLLQTEHGYETILLTEETIGEAVTQASLYTLFCQELKERVNAEDRLLIYFAGHGVALDGDDGPQGFLVPQDANPSDRDTFLPMTDLHGWLAALPCRHMLAILDCCFAGAFRWAAIRHFGVLPELIHKERYDRYITSPAWQVITSAAYDQKALDVLGGQAIGRREIPTFKHSPFAQAMFDGLEKGAADLVPKDGGDGVITATELYLYLREQVETEVEDVGREQTPGLWPLNKHGRGEYIFLTPGRELNLPPAPELTFDLNPWRGLKSYEQHHSHLLFGREHEIKELSERVEKQSFIAVLGASGTGKSSLVKAGLLPRLQNTEEEENGRQKDHGERVWYVLPPLQPGATPLLNLHALLKAQFPDHVDQGTLAYMRGNPQALSDLIAVWSRDNPHRKILLLVDQLEELVTMCEERKREQFLALLARAIAQQPETFQLIVTLRTDFEPQFDADSPLAPFWSDARYVVPPMDQVNLRQVIEGPASVRVLYFEPPELVDTLISEVIQTPGALPLLSFTLSELYIRYVKSRRDDRAIVKEDYDDLGGVIGSLRNRANEEYDALPDDEHRQTMQRVMLRMISVEGGELSRRRVKRSELIYPNGNENQRVELVIDRLVEARLLVTGSERGEATVEPAHDALVLAWDRLLRWKQEAEEYLLLQRRLTQASTEWSRAKPEARAGLLWDDDPRLPQLQETLWPIEINQKGLRRRIHSARNTLRSNWAAPADTKWLNDAELKFVLESVSRKARTLQRIISITAATIFILAGLALFATYQANQATQQNNARATEVVVRKTAEAIAVAESDARATEVVMRTTAEADAVRLAESEATVAADAIFRREEAEREARRARAGEMAAHANEHISIQGYVGDVALILARDAANATYKEDGFVTENASKILIDAVNEAPPHLFDLPRARHHGPVRSASFDGVGERIVTASDDGTALVWNVQSGQVIHTLSGHRGPVNSASFNTVGERIVTGSDDGMAKMWDADSGQEIRTFAGHVRNVNSANFDGSGQRIVTASLDGTAKLWDAETGQEILTLTGHVRSVSSASFDGSDQRIITASLDGTTKVWDAESGQEILTISVPAGEVYSARFDRTGKRIVTTSGYPTVEVWDAVSGDLILTLAGHTHSVVSASFDGAGERIVTASWDGTARVWDAESGEQMLKLVGHTDSVYSASFDGAGESIVTTGPNGTAKVWDAESAQEIITLAGHDGAVLSASFDKAGERIVTTSWDDTAKVWETKSGQEILTLSGHTNRVNSANFDGTGMRIVTASVDGTTRVWDAETGDEMLSFRSGPVNSASFDLAGERIVTDGYRAAKVWDAKSGDVMLTLLGHCEDEDNLCRLNSASFDGAGERIVTASGDGTARVWDANSGQLLLTLSGHSGSVRSASFDGAGERIVTTSGDTASVWDANSGQLLLTLFGHSGSVRSASFDGAGERIVTASDDGTARVWDTDSREALLILSGHVGSVRSASFDEAGERIVTASLDGSAKVWEAENKEELLILTGHKNGVRSASFDKDGERVVTASSDGTAKVWDVDSGQAILTYSEHRTSLNSASFDSEGERVVTAGWDRTADVWEAETGKRILTLGSNYSSAPTWSAKFDRAGQRIVTAHGNGTVKVWDVESGEGILIFSGHGWDEVGGRKDVNSGSFDGPGKRIITAGDDGTARVWDADDGTALLTLYGHTDVVNSASIDGSGQRIVTASKDGTVKVWDAESGEELLTLPRHTDEVICASFDGAGERIVTASADGTAKLWDAENGQEILTLSGHGCSADGNCGVQSASFDRIGERIVTAGDDGTARIWEANPEAWIKLANEKIQRNSRVLVGGEWARYGNE